MSVNKHQQNNDSDSKTMNADVLWKGIHRMISSATAKLEAMIESYVSNLEACIVCVERRIESIKDEYNNNLDNLTKEINSIRTDHQLKLQHLSRMERALDLVFTGVPYHPDEDLNQIYRRIACVIGAPDEHSIVHLKRLYKHPVRSVSSPPILCRFAFRGIRDVFFNKYLHGRSLALHHIGFEGKGRIYVNENLTPLSRRILNAAIRHRNEGRLHKVSTKNGLVAVITHKECDVIVVDTLDRWLLLESTLS